MPKEIDRTTQTILQVIASRTVIVWACRLNIPRSMDKRIRTIVTNEVQNKGVPMECMAFPLAKQQEVLLDLNSSRNNQDEARALLRDASYSSSVAR